MRQEPRDWGSLNFSESGWRRGSQLLLIRFATTRLHEICNGNIDGMEDWGGGTHSSPTALGLGISAPPQHNPNLRVFLFCFGLGGDTKVFYPPRPDYRRFKIPSFTSPGHTHSLVCAPTTTFSFSRPVMSYKLSFPIMHYRIYSQYHIYNA